LRNTGICESINVPVSGLCAKQASRSSKTVVKPGYGDQGDQANKKAAKIAAKDGSKKAGKKGAKK